MESVLAAINWRLDHPQIRNDDFFEGISFSSVDTLFIDSQSINRRWTYDLPVDKDGIRRTYVHSDRGFGRVLTRLFHKRRDETADLLYKAGGLVVCRLHPRGEALEVVSDNGVAEHIDRYSWLPSVSLVDKQYQLSFPSNARFLPRSGEDIFFENTGTPFEEYLRQFAGRISYRAVYQDLISTPIERFGIVLARNRVGDIVAAQLPYDEGLLVLLPPVHGVSPAEEASALLQAAKRATLRPAFFSEPDWLASYPLKGEDSLRDELSRLSDRREKISEKIEEISKRLVELTRYKRMLYTHGRWSVVPAVADALRILGFEVDEVGRDLIVHSRDGDALVVVAATDGQAIDVLDYRHLLDQVDRARTSGEGPGKGVMVVSASCALDPKRRPTEFKPEVLRGCKSQGFCLVRAYSLYKLVQLVLSQGPSQKELSSIRKAILECEGEFRGVS
jgi:hypothetical protein